MAASQGWDGPVVDAHQHFWEPAVNPHPWLAPDARIPFRYGDYSAIKRRYLPEEYREDSKGHNIVQTVYVETEWDPGDPIGETRYASDLADRYGWPNAIVAQAWLDRPDAAATLAAQAGFPLVRSVRHKPGGPKSVAEVGSGKTLMSDLQWRRGFETLARLGLAFDLQTPWWNLHEAVALANDFPEVTIILNHAGLPAKRDPVSLAGWEAAMTHLGHCPNAVIKLSGVAMPGERWESDSTTWIVQTAIGMFGPERTMFGSNFPVDSLCATYDEVLTGFKRILINLPLSGQRAFFCETARRVYSLPAIS